MSDNPYPRGELVYFLSSKMWNRDKMIIFGRWGIVTKSHPHIAVIEVFTCDGKLETFDRKLVQPFGPATSSDPPLGFDETPNSIFGGLSSKRTRRTP